MSDLVQWLRAQLDEDERIARAACKYASPEWHLDEEFGETVLWWPPEFHTPYEQDKHWRGQALDGHLAPHIAAHDPSRALREIEAKRDLLAFAKGVHDHHETFTTGVYARLEKTLRLYALAYKDRPGYRDEWRP